MTTEQQWLGNEPLSAALEDAEGRALVEAIHARKAGRLVLGVDPAADGGVWQYYRNAFAPTYDPFKESRALYAGGRGYGKTARMEAQIEGSRAAITWLDEYARFIAELYHDPYQEVRDLVVRTPWTEPSTIPEIASVRWACKSPTGHVSRSPLGEMWAQYTRDMVDGLAGRPYNRKLIEAGGSSWTSASGNWGDRQQ